MDLRKSKALSRRQSKPAGTVLSNRPPSCDNALCKTDIFYIAAVSAVQDVSTERAPDSLQKDVFEADGRGLTAVTPEHLHASRRSQND